MSHTLKLSDEVRAALDNDITLAQLRGRRHQTWTDDTAHGLWWLRAQGNPIDEGAVCRALRHEVEGLIANSEPLSIAMRAARDMFFGEPGRKKHDG